MWRGHGDDGNVQPIAAHHLLQLLDVVNRNSTSRFVADLLVGGVEERGDLETFLTKPRVIGQREAEIACAHDGHPQMAIEAENLPEVAAQFLDVVTDAPDTELAEVRQILANLRGVEMKLLGQGLGGDGLCAGSVELVETPQVDRQAIRSELRDLFWCLPTLVRTIHKVLMLASAAWRRPCRPRVRRKNPAVFSPMSRPRRWCRSSRRRPSFSARSSVWSSAHRRSISACARD